MACFLIAPLPSTTVLAPASAQAQSKAQEPVVAPTYPQYVLANCYAYVRYTIPSFPMASEIKANSTPHVGAVAIFDYSGLPHYGIISSTTVKGFWLTDSNYGGPGIRTHFIEWSDKAIKGFWST